MERSVLFLRRDYLGLAILHADDETFLHKALDEGHSLLVLQLARKVTHGEGGRPQGKIQGVLEETGEDNASGSIIEADRVAIDMNLIDDAAPRSHTIAEPNRRRLVEILNLARDIERKGLD